MLGNGKCAAQSSLLAMLQLGSGVLGLPWILINFTRHLRCAEALGMHFDTLFDKLPDAGDTQIHSHTAPTKDTNWRIRKKSTKTGVAGKRIIKAKLDGNLCHWRTSLMPKGNVKLLAKQPTNSKDPGAVANKYFQSPRYQYYMFLVFKTLSLVEAVLPLVWWECVNRITPPSCATVTHSQVQWTQLCCTNCAFWQCAKCRRNRAYEQRLIQAQIDSMATTTISWPEHAARYRGT